MVKKNPSRLTDERSSFKPFNYPWAYDAWLKHEQSHWLHTEVPMHEDVKDWKNKLSKEEKMFLTHIFRFFTQGDIDVAGGYVNNYLPYFPQPEVRMMLLGFAAREALHIAAYSHLIETLGLPETMYNEFMSYQEMKDKHDYVMDISNKNGTKENMMKLFKTYISENQEIWNDDLKSSIYTIAERMVELEDKFIDLAFGFNVMEGLTADELKKYIRYIADRRLIGLGMKGIFKVKRNPLPWVEEMINAPTHTNFFENRATDYAKGALSGSWDEVWSKAA
jgi:ribonucleoside-diphosphate reductase beta chain